MVTLVSRELQVLASMTGPKESMVGLVWVTLWPLAWVGVALLLPWRWRWLTLGCGLALSLLLAGADAAYWRYFQGITNVQLLGMAYQLVDVWRSISTVAAPEAVVPFLLVPIFVAVGLAGPGKSHRRPEWLQRLPGTKYLPRAPTLGFTALVLAGVCWGVAWQQPIYENTHHLNRSKWVKPAHHWGSRYSNVTFAKTFGLYNFHVVDLYRAALKHIKREEIDAASAKRIRELLEHKHQLNQLPSEVFGIASGRNVLVIQLEAFQQFLIDLEIDGKVVTPVLNHLREQALRWDYTMDITAHGRTADAEFAVMTGLAPDREVALQREILSTALKGLPRRLRELGYRTAAFHGYDVTFWNRDVAFPFYGFDDLFFLNTFAGEPTIGLGTTDPVVLDYVHRWLTSVDNERTFAFFSSLSSHHPYIATPLKYRQPYQRAMTGLGVTAAYLGAATYTDEALGAFWQKMRASGLLEKTLIVIYGDHDRGGLGTSKPIPQVGPNMFSASGDRVPLLMLIPGKEDIIREHAKQYQRVFASLRDVYPTIMHLLGEATPFGVTGTHLFVPNEKRDPAAHQLDLGTFYYQGILAHARGEYWTPNGNSPPNIDWAAIWKQVNADAELLRPVPTQADANLLRER